jgi:hypothetical protein
MGGVIVRTLALVAALLLSASMSEAASPYDGSVPIICAIATTVVCNSPDLCVRGTAESINFPPALTVDLSRRLITGFADGRTARITSSGRGAGQLMVHGEEVETLGRGWGIAISERSGRMTGAMLAPTGAVLIFGTCAEP